MDFLDLETVPVGVDVSHGGFCKGSLSLGDFWEDERASMEVNRGSSVSASPHTPIC